MKIWSCPDPELSPFPLKSVLFVCTGNICRSPMAEHLFRKLLPKGSAVEVSSAGVYAVEGNPALRNTVSAAGEMGLDLSDHRASLLSLDMIWTADLILGMETGHCEDVVRMAPDAAGKVALLGCYSKRKQALPSRDIEDPYGASLEAYRRCLEKIRDCVESLMTIIFPVENLGPDRR